MNKYAPRRVWINKFSNKPHILPFLLHLVFWSAVLIGLGWLAEKGLEVNEIADCKKWQQEAKVYKNFYLNLGQLEQCTHYQITIK